LVAQTVVKNCAPPLPATRPTAGRKTSVDAKPPKAAEENQRTPSATAEPRTLPAPFFMTISF
jgi:hypothetical protein